MLVCLESMWPNVTSSQWKSLLSWLGGILQVKVTAGFSNVLVKCFYSEIVDNEGGERLSWGEDNIVYWALSSEDSVQAALEAGRGWSWRYWSSLGTHETRQWQDISHSNTVTSTNTRVITTCWPALSAPHVWVPLSYHVTHLSSGLLHSSLLPVRDFSLTLPIQLLFVSFFLLVSCVFYHYFSLKFWTKSEWKSHPKTKWTAIKKFKTFKFKIDISLLQGKTSLKQKLL